MCVTSDRSERRNMWRRTRDSTSPGLESEFGTLSLRAAVTKEDSEMADDKSKRGKRDRVEVAGKEGYEIGYFAQKHRIPRAKARELIDKIGNNREKLNAAAKRLKGKTQ